MYKKRKSVPGQAPANPALNRTAPTPKFVSPVPTKSAEQIKTSPAVSFAGKRMKKAFSFDSSSENSQNEPPAAKPTLKKKSREKSSRQAPQSRKQPVQEYRDSFSDTEDGSDPILDGTIHSGAVSDDDSPDTRIMIETRRNFVQTERTDTVDDTSASDYLTSPTIDVTGSYFERIQQLGLQIIGSDQNGAEFYFKGEKTHDDIVSLIETNWFGNENNTAILMEELKNVLSKGYEYWTLFLSPIKNHSGALDSFIKALIRIKKLQSEVIVMLMKKLDVIAKNNSSPEDLFIAELILSHFPGIPEVFQPTKIFNAVFDKRLENWSPAFRDKMIEYVPDLIQTTIHHYGVAERLLELLQLKGLDSLSTLHQSCMNSLECLQVNDKMNMTIRYTLTKMIMYMDLKNIPLAVRTTLRIMGKSDNESFKNYLLLLCRFLDVEKLKRRDDDESNSEMSYGRCMEEIFSNIADYMKLDISKTQAALLKFFETSKKSSRNIEAEERTYEELESDEDDEEQHQRRRSNDDPDYEPPDENDEDDTSHQREFDLIDVMLLICLNEIRGNSTVILKEIRRQIAIGHDNYIKLKHVFSEAVDIDEFGLKFSRSLLSLAGDLVQSSTPQLNSIGGVIYRQLFLNQGNGEEILEAIFSHFSSVDHEATAALHILEKIAENDISGLRSHLEKVNTLVNSLSMLSVDNVRRVMFIMISVNLYVGENDGEPTQARRTKTGDRFLKQLENYLISTTYREVAWGIIGFVQYVRALLLFRDKPSHQFHDAETEILRVLKLVDDTTMKCGGRSRAEFYFQLLELLNDMAKFGQCEALINFGNNLRRSVRTEFYKDMPVVSNEQRRNSEETPSEFDNINIINTNAKRQINLAEMVLNDDSLDGPVKSLIPMLQLVKKFARYKMICNETSSESETVSKNYWNKFLFILESNVNLSPLKNALLSQHDQPRRCNVLFVTIEYVRTVLNMFADCKINQNVSDLLKQKLELLMLCQNQMTKIIRSLGIYRLPKITRVNKDDIDVKYKDPELKSKGKRNPRKKRAESKNITATAPTAQGDQPAEPSDSDDSDKSDEEMEVDQNETNLDEEEAIVYNMRKVVLSKSISVDQLKWYFTPMKLETITRLIQIHSFTKCTTLILVEYLYIILKHTMPTTAKQAPTGWGFGVPSPISTMDFGKKETRWKIVSDAVPSLFKMLSAVLMQFTTNTAQVESANPTDFMQEMANLLKFLVLIFSRIFQSKEIAAEPDPSESNAGNVISRRAKILAACAREIHIFNTSMEPYNRENRLSRAANATIMTSGRDSNFNNQIFENRTESSNEEMIYDASVHETALIEFFLRVADYVPTMESAAALLALLKTFKDPESYHRRKFAQKAIFFLGKTWKDFDNLDKVDIDEKHSLEIATDYLNFRAEKDRINAVSWLIFNQLVKTLPEENIVDIKTDTIKDDETFVGDFDDVSFQCFTKKTFPSWHKFLFKHLIDNVSSYMKSTNKELNATTKEFGILWTNIVDSVNILCLPVEISVAGYETQNVMVTMTKELKRFFNFIMSKQSSLNKIFSDKDLYLANEKIYSDLIKRIREIYMNSDKLRTHALKKKGTTLLKLLPDLRASREKLYRGIFATTQKAGFDDFKFAWTTTNNVNSPNASAKRPAVKTPRPTQKKPTQANHDDMEIIEEVTPVTSNQKQKKRANKPPVSDDGTPIPVKKRGKKSTTVNSSANTSGFNDEYQSGFLD